MTLKDAEGIERMELPSQSSDSILISEIASLYAAMERLDKCETAFSIFAIDCESRVTGVLTRGDVIRCLLRNCSRESQDLQSLMVKDAMTPRMRSGEGSNIMVYIEEHGRATWYEQLTRAREENRSRWHRIKLLPVLDGDMRLVNILDLESPRPRARLEALVMAEAFPLKHGPDVQITDAAMARRRSSFDSIHYGSHRQKVTGLCNLLLKRSGGSFSMLDDVFNNARADEIVHGLYQSEEWLKGHVSDSDMKKGDQKVLLEKIAIARGGLVDRYTKAGTVKYFPVDAEPSVWQQPELIIVLGCEGEIALRERVSAAVDVVRLLKSWGSPPTIVLSGGGFGHEKSEASRMLDELITQCKEFDSDSSVNAQDQRPGWWTLRFNKRSVDVVLEEDSLDTLGNAVFSWLTLKLEGDKFGLTASSPKRLQRLLLVTDGMHAPRSYDVFRRVFAFRSGAGVEPRPKMAVRTIDKPTLTPAEHNAALDHLRSEARVNGEIFRLVNPLTNGYVVIDDGHVRSILGQMLRLHKLYGGRWGLVRKYQKCWYEARRTETDHGA